MNIDNENVTLKTTYGNENLYFSDSELNERLFHNPPVKATAFNQIVDIGNATTGYNLNWVLYSETLFPSKINEFTTGSSTRVGYDNLYWRDTRSARNTLHDDNIFTNSFGVYLTQSAWPLDEPTDFLTRAENEVPYVKLASNIILRISNSAGELQNEYFHIISGSFATFARRKTNLAASALYARKHVLPGATSIVSPSGIPIAETGSYTTKFDVVVGLYTGEAAWEADSQAGIIKKDSGVATFQSHRNHGLTIMMLLNMI
jgi:YHS domain-containing protein